jgi:CBS domain-containing protein
MSKAASALKHFLMEHTVSEIRTATNNDQSKIVELDSTLLPFDAAKILFENNIVGAPVWNKDSKVYVGFFEMRDILSAVVAAANAERDGDDGMTVKMDRYNEHMVKELNSPSSPTSATDKKTFADACPNDHTISYLAVRNHFASCKSDATLYDLCECLAKRNCHRVPIVNRDGKCQDMITQTALIKFISDNCPTKELQQTIKEAKIPYEKKVASVLDTANASEAFTLLDNRRLSGVAVVDEDGKLIGNTSARDIKLAAIDEGKTAMDMDIISYLAKVRQSHIEKKERYPSCHVHENATVANVIDLLAKTGYHRVFVVDENVRPIGVISVSDITSYATQ